MSPKSQVLSKKADFGRGLDEDRKSTRLNSSHSQISYAVFCLKKKKERVRQLQLTRTALNQVSPRDRDSVPFHVVSRRLASADDTYSMPKSESAASVKDGPNE